MGRSFGSEVGGSNRLQGQVHGPTSLPNTAAASNIAPDMGLAETFKIVRYEKSPLDWLSPIYGNSSCKVLSHIAA